MRLSHVTLSGWGRYPRAETTVARPESVRELVQSIKAARHVVARGSGRSYGDASFHRDGTSLLTERLDRLLAFDADRGIIRAEAGITLSSLLKVVMARGWHVPVLPGTQYCSLGGCIAADVHGKNHPTSGSFSRWVRGIRMILADGAIVECGPDLRPDLFWATMGGMGLTGIVIDVELQLVPLPSRCFEIERHTVLDVESALAMLEPSDSAHRAAWIDGTDAGRWRGVVVTATPAERASKSCESRTMSLRLPFDLPANLIRRHTVRAGNRFARTMAAIRRRSLHGIDKALFPLDGIGGWNRIYGNRGFVQYQVVIPPATSRTTIRQILTQVDASPAVPTLAVLKRLGDQGPGPLSFPMHGYTLALDFPMTEELTPLLDALDDIVAASGGRVYLAKDARLRPEHLARMYPRLEDWREVKRRIDPTGVFASDLGCRLGLS